MFKWLAKIRGVRGAEWIVAAIAAGAVLLLLLGGGTDAATEYEKRLQGILQCVDGAGRVRVMVNEYQRDGSRCTGVVVVSEGADSIRVCLELSRAVCSLTGADASDVEIISMSEK